MLRLRSVLVIQMLLAAGAAAALVPLPGCSTGCRDPWLTPEAFDLPVEATILGDVWSTYDGSQVLVGSGGVIVEDVTSTPRIHRPVTADLRGVTITRELVVAVGDGGTVVVASRGSDEWQVIDLGTTADLHAVTTFETEAGEEIVVVVGEGVMFARAAETGAWSAVPAPKGGWGSLRGVDAQPYTGTIVAVGRGGAIWRASDPNGTWQREDSGTSEDLTIVRLGLIGGTNGTLLRLGDDGTLHKFDLGTDSDVLDVHPVVLTADGRVFEFEAYEDAPSGAIYTLGPGLRVVIEDGESEYGLVALGEPGKHRHLGNTCVPYEGRPFIVEDVARTAAVVRRGDWGAEDRTAEVLPAATRAALAEGWTQAALAEHASIASFARAVLELMSLGAPAELLRATQAALADEVEHAARSFAQASRYRGAPCGPGPLVVDAASLARAGDPAAIAVAVFEEGCVGESVSAAQAALAAEECRDTEVAALLRDIAREEGQHAALAWQTLRWLVDTYGELVAAPLRRAAAGLTAPLAMVGGPDLRAHGRLSAAARAAIHRAVVRDVVRPIADALLGRREAVQA
ncbi:MAG TPA: hypothetical protein VGB85_28610 [Nannocystis sp.]